MANPPGGARGASSVVIGTIAGVLILFVTTKPGGIAGAQPSPDVNSGPTQPVQQFKSKGTGQGYSVADGVRSINSPATRADNELYQNGQPVGRAIVASVDTHTGIIVFAYIWDTEGLDFQEPVAFQRWIIKIVRINFRARTLVGIGPDGHVGRNIIPNVIGQIVGESQ